MNKDFLDSMNIDTKDVCLFFVEGIGMIIGTLENLFGSFVVINPRIVQILQGKPPTLSLQEPLGQPKRMFLARPPVFLYKAKDPKILNLYQETVSTIKIVSQIPKNNNAISNLFGGKKP
jgi:hypothetical protein